MFEIGYEKITVPARDWRNNRNGGDYDFTYYFELRNDGFVKVEYGTSAEFGFCKVRGQFQQCENCPDYDDDNEHCRAFAKFITREQAEKMILRLEDEIRGIEEEGK